MVELEASQHNNGTTQAPYMADEDQLSKEDIHESFASMNLHKDLLRGIYACGLDKPSPIQQRATVPFCEGRHMVLEAPRGAGVRGMFSLGILQQLNYRLYACQALVLAPNRDLVPSIEKKICTLGEYLNVKVHTCTGGTSIREDKRVLENGVVHVVVGTIGRVLDLLRRGVLVTNHIKTVVLYDAGGMFSGKGAVEEIYVICEFLPSNIQVCITSTLTTPALFTQMAHKLMHKPLFITEKLHLPEGLKHFFVKVMKEGQKLIALCDVLRDLAVREIVVFVNGQLKVHALERKMLACDHLVSAVHGCMKQDTATSGTNQFKCGSSSIVITTDMLASTLDLQESCVIVNYDIPQPETYLHRVFGRKGIAISIVSNEDERSMQDIQSMCNVEIEELPYNVENLIKGC